MKPSHFSPLFLTIGLSACAHAPKPYTFAAEPAGNDVDVVIQTLQSSGLKPAAIDRKQGMVTTHWFDTGDQFHETDIRDSVEYPTDIFLRYRISLKREAGKETVVLDADVKSCANLDVTVTPLDVLGSCESMTTLFPSQQKQIDALGEKLREALRGIVEPSGAGG
jgi:hypothetical protein